MRGNWTPALAKLLQRADVAARDLIEAVAVRHAAQKVTDADWAAADSLSGLEADPRGGLTLSGAQTTLIALTSSDGYETNLGWGDPIPMAQLAFLSPPDAAMEIRRVTCYLHPDQAGTGQQVATWQCRLWALIDDSGQPTETQGNLSLAPVGDIIEVAAGASAGDVLFDFAAQGAVVRPADWGRPTGGGGWYNPVFFVQVSAIQSNGAPAGSVGWGCDSAYNSVTSGIAQLSPKLLTQVGGRWTAASGALGCERVTVETGNYTAATVAFTGGNKLDLGAVPASASEVRFRVEGRVPPGTSVAAKAKVSGGDPWTDVADGQTAADAGLAASQTYMIEAILTPNASGNARPSVLVLGVEDATVTDLSDTAQLAAVSYAVDPFDLHAEIPQATLTALRDGLPDYRDALRLLLAENDIAALEIRWSVGKGTTRMPLDTFLIDETADVGPNLELTLVSQLGLVNGVTPIPQGTSPNITRSPKVYANQSLKAASDDLLDSEAALPARYRGPGISDATTQVAKTIRDSTIKAELDNLAFIAGGSFSTSQGRVKFFDAYGAKSVVAYFPMEEIAQGRVSPGWSRRSPEYYLRYAYNEATQDFDKENKASNATALANVGVARIMPPKWGDDEIGRWISDDAVATALTVRQVRTFGFGEILIPFQAIYRHPQIELHDLVAVETDRFVARDPMSGRALRGQLWALCDIVGIHDPAHTQFTGWVRSFSDIVVAATDIVLRASGVAYCRCYLTTDFSIGATSTGIQWDVDEADPYGMHDPVTNNTRFYVPAGGAGRWQITLFAVVTAVSNGASWFDLYVNGGRVTGGADSHPSDPFPLFQTLTITVDLQEGDYVEMNLTNILYSTTIRGGSGGSNIELRRVS